MTQEHHKGHPFLIENFDGLNESENEFADPSNPGGMHPNQARRLEELRPDGGSLVKVRGNQQHSVFSWKGADRPCTLIRWAKEDGTAYWVMTAWDNVFVYESGAWVPLLKPSKYGGYHPSQLLEYLNRRFDWCVYKDSLYLTDGSNRMLRFDGNNIGPAGLQKFTGVTVIAGYDCTGTGDLPDEDFKYQTTLYDDVNELEGNISDAILTLSPMVPTDLWINLSHTSTPPWIATGNYDYHNSLARYVRLYRTAPAGWGVEGNRYLVGQFRAGLLATGVIEALDDLGATGRLTDADGRFNTNDPLNPDETATGDKAINVTLPSTPVCYIDHDGTFTPYQVTGLTDTTLILEDSSGGAFGAGANHAGCSYYVFGGIKDSVYDLSDNELYFGDEPDEEDVTDHSPPPLGAAICMYGDRNNRCHLAGDPAHPNRVYYSALGFPDYWPQGNWNDLDSDDSDAVNAIIKFQGKLLYFKRKSITIGHVDGDPATWVWIPKALSVGASHRRIIADCGGLLIFANSAGVYAYDGQSLNLLSDRREGSNIKQTWERVVKEELSRGEAVYHEDRKEFWLSVCLRDHRGAYDSARVGGGEIEEEATS